jgi:AcrR family transcriptional regulator
LTKEKIIEKALDLFAHKGYEGTSMEDIAQEVGIKKASLYSHYAGKEIILREVFGKVLKEYSEYLNSLIMKYAGDSIKERLFGIFYNYVLYFMDEKMMNFWIKIYLSPPDFIKKEFLKETYKIEMDFIARLYNIFREGIKKKQFKRQSARNTVMAFYYMMLGFGMTAAFYKEKSLKKSIEGCLEVFWNGIKY